MAQLGPVRSHCLAQYRPANYPHSIQKWHNFGRSDASVIFNFLAQLRPDLMAQLALEYVAQHGADYVCVEHFAVMNMSLE